MVCLDRFDIGSRLLVSHAGSRQASIRESTQLAVCAGDISGNYAGSTANVNRYGWFWVGGVCPVQDLTNLEGDITTDGAVTAGQEGIVTDDGANGVSIGGFYDASLLADATVGVDWRQAVVGFATATDA